MLTEIRRLWAHARWADLRMLAGLQAAAAAPEAAVGEFAHVLGTSETWLSRLERRPASLPIWPAAVLAELGPAAESVHAGYDRYLARLDEAGLGRTVEYVNSAGQRFETPVGDILLHAALHAQYHRGKVNVLLRQAGLAPVPSDYIAFVRGVPAAVTKPR